MSFWSGNAFYIDQRVTNTDALGTSFGDVLVSTPNTLLRTLIWVYAESWAKYEEGDSALLNEPVSWAFTDFNSDHHSPGELSHGPGNATEELIATDIVPMAFTGLGWPPNSTGHLSGSVNELDSSATLATDYNLNAFMHGAGRSYVDSHAQRRFSELPVYGFTFHDWHTGVAGGIVSAFTGWVMVRLLYAHP